METMAIKVTIQDEWWSLPFGEVELMETADNAWLGVSTSVSLPFGEVELMETAELVLIVSYVSVASLRGSGINGNESGTSIV